MVGDESQILLSKGLISFMFPSPAFILIRVPFPGQPKQAAVFSFHIPIPFGFDDSSL